MAQATYQWSMVAQATPDECFQGNANDGLTPEQAAANNASFNSHYPAGLSPAEVTSCKAEGGLPKINQAYVWGLTRVGNNLFFSTVANTLCLVMDSYYGSTPAPTQNNSWVCDMANGEDFKPPRIFVYDTATASLADLTPKVIAGGDLARLRRTFGLRSAGNYNGVVFFGGLLQVAAGKSAVVLYAFNAETQAYIGSYLFDGSDEAHPLYTNIRQWHVISNQLFTGVALPGGGTILRWTGSLANPFSFVEVAALLGDPAYFVEHKGNVYVSTWGSGGGRSGMSLYMSPALHGEVGLEDTDKDLWTEVWNLNQYEVEPAAVQGGGALASFDGYLYWGTMHVPATGVVAFQTLYPDAPVDTNTFINTTRAIAIFRSQGFDPAQVESPYVELLYGHAQLPKYDEYSGTWYQQSNNMGQSPLYGTGGFGNPFNNYTWEMQVFNNRLYVGTMDWSYLATNGGESSILPAWLQSIAPTFYGADLWSFADSNSAAVPVNINGMGNFTSYGIRNMVATDDTLWIGMANPMNLRSDPTDNPGGWKLLSFPLQDGLPSITWNNPADITYGTPLSATQLNATTVLPGRLDYAPPAGTVLNAGAEQNLSVTFTPNNSGNQWSKTVPINVNKAPLTVTGANATMVYGSAIPALTGTMSGIVNGDDVRVSFVTTATSETAVGTYSITPLYTDPNNRLVNYEITQNPGTLTITQAGTVVRLSASVPTTFAQSPITFTARVTSVTSGTPTGTVTFKDGTTSIGTANLDESGTATLTLSTLSAGSRSITAVYGGNGNYQTSTSSAFTATIQDFQLGGGTGNVVSATVASGQTASFSVTVAPTSGGAFPANITLSLSGLPAGASTTLTPTTITAGSGSQTITIQVLTARTTAMSRGLGLTFAFALLPMVGLVSLRKRTRVVVVLMLVLLAAGMLASFGCGSSSTAAATSRAPQTYPLTLTATSGTLQHSTTLNLTIQ